MSPAARQQSGLAVAVDCLGRTKFEEAAAEEDDRGVAEGLVAAGWGEWAAEVLVRSVYWNRRYLVEREGSCFCEGGQLAGVKEGWKRISLDRRDGIADTWFSIGLGFVSSSQPFRTADWDCPRHVCMK